MPEIKIIDEKKPAAKKKTTAKKKTSSASTIRLTAAEKKLVQNYRKCNALEKEIIAALCEKMSGDLLKEMDLKSELMTTLGNLLK